MTYLLTRHSHDGELTGPGTQELAASAIQGRSPPQVRAASCHGFVIRLAVFRLAPLEQLPYRGTTCTVNERYSRYSDARGFAAFVAVTKTRQAFAG
jgi:hypothetical protein